MKTFSKARQNIGGSIYTCSICEKNTRDTGKGEGPFNYCFSCYRDCVIENLMSDEGLTKEEATKQADEDFK